MIRIRLSEPDAQLLEDEYRRCEDAAHRDRLQIVRLAARDRPHQQIADDLGITPRTVQRWLNRYLERGQAGLRPRKAKGAEARILPDLADEVRRWVIEGPAAQGLEFRKALRAEDVFEVIVGQPGVRDGGLAQKLGGLLSPHAAAVNHAVQKTIHFGIDARDKEGRDRGEVRPAGPLICTDPPLRLSDRSAAPPDTAPRIDPCQPASASRQTSTVRNRVRTST